MPTDRMLANEQTISKRGAPSGRVKSFLVADIICLQIPQFKSRDALRDESQACVKRDSLA